MIYITFTCSSDLYNKWNFIVFIVNQTFSIMNKSFFKVKKKNVVPRGCYGCHTITRSRLKLLESLVRFTYVMGMIRGNPCSLISILNTEKESVPLVLEMWSSSSHRNKLKLAPKNYKVTRQRETW